VTSTGNQFDIRGGTLSENGANLFHSFQQLNLDPNQIANFISNGEIQNILGRVVGGDPSVINGLIQISGGQSNLYLLNPAGMIFGAASSLNVPASFFATTASSIGFDNGWFNASGSSPYLSLTGNPTSFAFSSLSPGVILNAGHLAVMPGQSLTLLGGTVLNIGALSAPGGNITIAATPGQNLVRFSQEGSLLSLEFQSLSAQEIPFSLPYTPLALPQLLTGGALNAATGVSVNPDGIIQLAGSEVKIPTDVGTAIASGYLSVSNAEVSSPSISSLSSPSINILGTQVGLVSATIDASSLNNGGVVRIGGDYQGQGTVPNAVSTYASHDTSIRADSLQEGNGGRVIVWADDSTRFYGSISAQGGPLGGNGGLIETSGKNYLDVAGASIQAAAPKGQSGSWLLDPQNVRILDTATMGGALSGGNPNIFSPSADDAIISTQDITNALNNGVSVRIVTGTTGTQAGNIVVESPLTVAANGNPTLSLEAANNIAINQSISSSGPLSFSFIAGNSITLNAPVRTGGGNYTSNSRSQSGGSQVNTAGTRQTGSIRINDLTTLANQSTLNQQQLGSAIKEGPSGGNRPGGDGNLAQRFGGPGTGSLGQNGGPRELQSGNSRLAERQLRAEFAGHLRIPGNLAAQGTSKDILSQVQSATGVKPALVYLSFTPALVATQSEQNSTKEQSHQDGHLEIILVTPDGKSISKQVAGATQEKVLAAARAFSNGVADPRKANTDSYLLPAQQLYSWLIAPIEPELKAREINNLAFIATTGLRFIPLAALHDGQQFLVEKYSVGLMPSLDLTDTRYVSLKDAQVLAAGASTFDEQAPLPAVPVELSVITQDLSQGRSLLNSAFTLNNLKAERQRRPFQIIHLATHGEFQPGALDNSYIQLWDSKLQLDQLRELGWNDPPVELLVLSACRTALGSDEAELGFAGFALQAGVKSALASLWYISDEGTLAFMSEFYQRLRTSPIKAEALRQTQIAMLNGKVTIQGGQLRSSRGSEISLPPELIVSEGNRALSHPFYWAAFTLIGSPW
jgi:filamentous hemagglutinin family protein